MEKHTRAHSHSPQRLQAPPSPPVSVIYDLQRSGMQC